MHCDERRDDGVEEAAVPRKAAIGHVDDAGVRPAGDASVGGDGGEVGDVGRDEHALLHPDVRRHVLVRRPDQRGILSHANRVGASSAQLLGDRLSVSSSSNALRAPAGPAALPRRQAPLLRWLRSR